jgi:hypothetical protein
MSLTDALALIGAITGTIGTMLGLAALIWDYYKWRYAERVLLRVTANPGMVSTQKPDEKLIMVSVTNVGKIPTTINLLSLHGFNSKKALKKRNGENVAIAHRPLYCPPLPHKLSPGDDWTGFLLQHSNGMEEYLNYRYFIIQVEDSMSTRPFRAEVDKERMKADLPKAR